MAKIQLNVARKVVPMIYAYTTPEIQRQKVKPFGRKNKDKSNIGDD